MNNINELQLTYIPSEYWNDERSEFILTEKSTNIPSEASFFILWQSKGNSVTELEKSIGRCFSEIPLDKLLSCQVNLAFISENTQNEGHFLIRKVDAKILPLLPASKMLNQLEIFEKDDSKLEFYYSDSIRSWALITKLIFELLNRGNFVPILEKRTEKKFTSHWRLILKDNYDHERYQKILQYAPYFAYNIPGNFIRNSESGLKDIYTENLWHPTYLFSDYIDTIGDLLIRSMLKKSNFRELSQFYNIDKMKEKRREFGLSWDYKFLKSLLKDENDFSITQFHETIIPKLIKNWVNIAQTSTLKHSLTIGLKLDYPDVDQEKWQLQPILHSQKSGKSYTLSELWESEKSEELEFLKYFNSQEEFIEILLRSLGTISKIYPPSRQALNGSYPKPIALSSSEVMNFLGYPKDLLIQSGFNVILPDVFKKGGRQRLSTKMVITSKKEKKRKGISSSTKSIFQINDMIKYKWEVELGDETLSKEELNELLENEQSLINWRGEWILLDNRDVANLKQIFENSDVKRKLSQPEGQINYMEAIKLGLAGKVGVDETGPTYEVVIEGHFEEIVSRIKSLKNFEEVSQPENFEGELRPYQKTGLTWMTNMCALNFGLCLADDMGLGKTIQIIALLQHFKQNYGEELNSVLVICPTSVLYNWKREINKFGPDLAVEMHHGPNRIKDPKNIGTYLQEYQIILTSYGTIRNDVDLLKTLPFSGVIVDESQNMKNYEAQQTQAIYQLQSQYRICLSGTPIENRLMELWTLFNFLNPGLLGSRKEFQEEFVIPIERFHNKEAIEKLKTIISPFILRRVKTDKSVISDLPEKNEMKIYVELSETQLKLYKELVNDILNKFESGESKEQGKSILILSMLTKLKQICNHPYQYLHKKLTYEILKENYDSFISQSPKLERLLDMLDEVIDKNEKAIIFTQFTQMGDILETILQYKYDFPILYFHGSVPAEKRKTIVESFQSDSIGSPPILILSLKAGGTGLNLTGANTVFHIDRWWNPAVERQATDRAYRIGQTEPVNVYKFITIDTIEEKIDKLIQEKKELADAVIASGESWISELSDEKIKDLISISK
jgi:SNF2 family DNA or RNA helicase